MWEGGKIPIGPANLNWRGQDLLVMEGVAVVGGDSRPLEVMDRPPKVNGPSAIGIMLWQQGEYEGKRVKESERRRKYDRKVYERMGENVGRRKYL